MTCRRSRGNHIVNTEETQSFRLGLSLTSSRPESKSSLRSGVFAAHREMSELSQWAEAKLRTVHRLRSALYSEDELPAAGRHVR